ncbi:MAG: 2-hydroxyacid dehydrogenase, partial [Isosphaeraceae bacterium]
IRSADVLSLHVPITPETRHLIRQETIEAMKPQAILLNTSRGGLVKESDLIPALKTGRLAGACLDVSDPEPPLPASELRTLANVVISPHLGGIDSKSMADMADLAARCVVEKLSGREPVNCIVSY